MFQFSKIVKDLIWHAQEREFDGNLHHLFNSPSWKLVYICGMSLLLRLETLDLLFE